MSLTGVGSMIIDVTQQFQSSCLTGHSMSADVQSYSISQQDPMCDAGSCGPSSSRPAGRHDWQPQLDARLR